MRSPLLALSFAIALFCLSSCGTGTPVHVNGQLCTPNERSCDGDRLLECSSDGESWFLVRECAEGCENGACICTPDCHSRECGPDGCGGSCGSCADGQVCNNGVCTGSCDAGYTECDGICVDLQSDPEHCGRCHNPCSSGQSCLEGTCFGTATYTVTLLADPSVGGTVTGGGTYEYGEQATVSASPAADYTFDGWYEQDNHQSDRTDYTFTVSRDISLTARFSTPEQTHTVMLTAEPAEGGSPSIGTAGGPSSEDLIAGTQVTVHANPNAGFSFSGWFEGATILSVEESYSFTVQGDVSLTARYEADMHDVIVSADPPQGGSPSINTSSGPTSQAFAHGTEVTVYANANSGYGFTGWYEAGSLVSSSANYNFLVERDISLLARFEQAGEVTRVEGSDRYTTAVEVSKQGWPGGSHTVLLARGDEDVEDNPGAPLDAAAGTPLAYALDAPILITRSDSLVASVRSEIQRLNASMVIILGGPVAISNSVESELQGMGLSTERISGANRYATAALIADRLKSARGVSSISTAYVVHYQAFSDALAAAPYAARSGFPILLVADDTLPPDTEAAFSSLGINNVFVLGGTQVISQGVYNAIPVTGSKERISGATRYDTSVQLANRFLGSSDEIFILNGLHFVDAMSAAAWVARAGSGILWVASGWDEPHQVVQDYLMSNAFTWITIVGGPVAVSSGVEAWLESTHACAPDC